MKLLHNNIHIKNIPKKYESIKNASDFLECEDLKRLSPEERKSLDEELVRLHFLEFVSQVKSKGIMAELLNNQNPVAVAKITTRNRIYHALQFSNGMELVCSGKFYNSSPIKKNIKRLY